MTFQSSWADYDDDGDPDLYVCNDFGPDRLYRNDGDRGLHRRDCASGLTLGFGMGVSWGDYDNDQQLDLYVSNMYSKAGAAYYGANRGILTDGFVPWRGQLSLSGGPERDFKEGRQIPMSIRRRAGWSWGGQFVDVNNDGNLSTFMWPVAITRLHRRLPMTSICERISGGRSSARIRSWQSDIVASMCGRRIRTVR